jgi:assimilatory nitrate reductase catalytic subunit
VTVRTTCPYCGVGCGVLVDAGAAGISVRGDPKHPANRGALCSKGAALGETVGLQGRLLAPQLHGRDVDWDTALGAVSTGFRRIIDQHGPDSVAFYVSGQLLTEDYYVANKLMKGFIGSANIDTNSRLCMSSAVAAHQRAFGEDLVPVCYDDLDAADLIVLVGSNTAWCHPVLYQRIVRLKEQRPLLRLVVIDPRRTPTCDIADLHLPLRAGTDVMLFNGLLAWLAQHDRIDAAYLRRHTRGAARALLTAENTAGDVDWVARRCGIDRDAVFRFYEWFAATPRVITAFSQGVNQSSAGTDKANAIINVHLASGRIGREGMGPFSITGQPNAMGGREVGGLATMLAAHLDLANGEHRAAVQDFWQSPCMADRAGFKAVDLFQAIYDRKVRAVWIMATNPVVSMPRADRTLAALRRCELVVVSDCMARTDTTALAHVLLPAAAWGEKSGTATNSDRHISRQRAFRPPPGDARPDWWAICQVARRMGYETGFEFESAAEIFDEHARLSSVAHAHSRTFDLSGLAGRSESDYDSLEPIQWPVPSRQSLGTARLFADGRFSHADGRARLIAVRPRSPRHAIDEEYPLVLNTGRIRDQWHTMTRSGLAPRLGSHLPEPYVDMHPADALRFGLRKDSLVRVATRWGRMVVRLRTSGEMTRGAIFVPIHWCDATASDARVGALVSPAVDPLSGEPEFKYTPARVEPFLVSWHGFVLSRGVPALQKVAWWAAATGEHHQRFEMAGRQVPGNWSAWTRSLLGVGAEADWIEYDDAGAGTYRAAHFEDERLSACVFIASRPDLPSRTWLATLFARDRLAAAEREALLAGRPPDPSAEAGATICACFGVGRRVIESAVRAGCDDAAAIGKRVKAGTNCGSCVPELRRIVAAVKAETEAGAARC